MAINMLDFNEAFPKKVNIDQYKAVIDGALNASVGKDGVPRVVVETFDTAAKTTKAANAIRNHSRDNNLGLRVSCPEGKQLIMVYKAPPRSKKKRVPSAQTTAAPSSPAEPSNTGKPSGSGKN